MRPEHQYIGFAVIVDEFLARCFCVSLVGIEVAEDAGVLQLNRVENDVTREICRHTSIASSRSCE